VTATFFTQPIKKQYLKKQATIVHDVTAKQSDSIKGFLQRSHAIKTAIKASL
jgi:hypothetical protein